MYQFDPEQITLFARTDARGQEVPFGIKAKDRTRHVYVIGKTGMGKSTLLENMAVQDIKNGNGMAFIDPHGQTAETLLDYIPEERKEDVLYFAPFDTEHPVSFNIMEDVGEDKRHLVVSGLMSVFKKIWVDAWSARMEYILSNTLLALLEYPDSTLLGVNRMLSDKTYRKKVVNNITDPAVKSFWVDEFANYNERYMQEAGDAIKNKIGQFTSNPLIRNIVGQPKSSFDIREIMDERKILIMNLSKGLVGEQNANLLGSMLTTRIYLAAMSRADLSVRQMEDMPNFYFYVDEFQSFANATFADILSEARKYKLNLTIAHQYIEQMEEEVRNAVFGNVGTIISFRVGPFDAEVLETVFAPQFTAVDICNLGFAQIYLSLMIDGIGSAPFSATTLPPIEPAAVSYKDVVIHSSRQQFAHDRQSVETTIHNWHENAQAESLREHQEASAAGQQRSVGNNGRPPQRKFDDRPPKRPPQRQSEDRPPRRKEDRPSEPKTSTNNKSLDELRAVLKSISEDEQERQAKKVTKEKAIQSKAETKKGDQSKSVGDNGLRSALAAAIGDATTVKETKPTDSPKMQKPKPQKSKSTKKDKLEKNRTESQPKPKPTAAEPETDDTEATKAKLAAAVAAVVPQTDVRPAGGNGSPQSPQNSPAQTSAQSTNPTTPDPLAPKKLERMMRVTGSDKTPLK